MRIDFHIPCEVLPKQSMRGGAGRYGSGRVRDYYTPTRIKDNAAELASLMLPYRQPLMGSVSALYVVCYPYRASEPQRNRHRPIPKTTRPDGDNLAKQINDVLESVGFIADDSCIFDTRVVKLWDLHADLYVVLNETDWASGIERLER